MITSTVCAHFPQSVEKVWDVLTDVESYPRWRGDVCRVELVPDGFIEYAPSGFATRFTVTQRKECALWGFDIENDKLTGFWLGELRAVGDGTQVTFTELVRSKNPLLRPFVKSYLRRQQQRFTAELKAALWACCGSRCTK